MSDLWIFFMCGRVEFSLEYGEVFWCMIDIIIVSCWDCFVYGRNMGEVFVFWCKCILLD